MKEISSAERSYFLYNCLSISETDLLQSMSLFVVKSCNGTLSQVSRGLSCVTFSVPSIARANFVFIYFMQFSASFCVLNFPTLKNVVVEPTIGSPTIGVDSTSPIAPRSICLRDKYFIRIKIVGHFYIRFFNPF